MGRTREKHMYSVEIIVAEHNSMNTKEFIYDEVKKLQNQKKSIL